VCEIGEGDKEAVAVYYIIDLNCLFAVRIKLKLSTG
jgi:hypothetical protein